MPPFSVGRLRWRSKCSGASAISGRGPSRYARVGDGLNMQNAARRVSQVRTQGRASLQGGGLCHRATSQEHTQCSGGQCTTLHL